MVRQPRRGPGKENEKGKYIKRAAATGGITTRKLATCKLINCLPLDAEVRRTSESLNAAGSSSRAEVRQQRMVRGVYDRHDDGSRKEARKKESSESETRTLSLIDHQ